MARFQVVVEAYVASRAGPGELVAARVLGRRSRRQGGRGNHGRRHHAALVKLAERGRLKASRGMTATAAGKPLAGARHARFTSWSDKLGVSRDNLRETVARVGPMRQAVERALRG